jgi:hypothetical protein
VCTKPAVYVDVVVRPTGEPDGVAPDGRAIEHVTFQAEPGIITCAECKADLVLSVHECGQYTLVVL